MDLNTVKESVLGVQLENILEYTRQFDNDERRLRNDIVHQAKLTKNYLYGGEKEIHRIKVIKIQ